MRRDWLVGFGTACVLVLAGCSSDSDADGTTTSAADAATEDEGSDPHGDPGPLGTLPELGDGQGRVPSPDDALTPEAAREELVAAGYECGDIEDYEPVPGDEDLGVTPSATFSCDGEAGAVEFLVAADEADVGRLFVLVESAVCDFEPDLTLTGEGRWLAGPRDENDPGAVARVAELLGTDVLPFECG